ncbi:MAG: aminotransferase class III-fold pyridoxal phosphate-dependent enzyme, partial [Adhaeribacter sp.]
GNGFPIGGLLLNPKFKARYGMLGTTFGGNYLACAAAIAVLDVIRDENLVQQAEETGHYLMEKLRRMDGVSEVRGYGLMIGIEFPYPIATLRKELLEEYHIFTGSASNKNTLRVLPALNLKKEEADIFLEALTQILAKTLV